MALRIHRRPLLLAAAKGAVLIGACALVWDRFADVDGHTVLNLIQRGGPWLALLFVPVLMMTMADSIGWRLCHARSAHSMRLGRLYRIRVGTDALLNAVPGGVAIAETMRPILVRRECGVEYDESISASVIAKIIMTLAHLLFLIGGLLAFIFSIGGTAFLPLWQLTLLVCAAVLAVWVVTIPFRMESISSLFRAASRIRSRSFRSLLERLGPLAQRIDTDVLAFTRSHRARFGRAFGAFALGWLCLASETFLIATLLGTNLTLGQAILFEGAVSLLRAAFFFLPGALGAQEAGTVLLFQALGIPDPGIAAAAFVLLRRLRELVWIVVGLFLLWRFQMHPLARATALPEAFPA
ncbi:MAG: flippase-like domain-containing protein [Ignavibacteria bacterium]|nr:flippase-like domain-containing protein [Ignavibacteria bacterium]